VLLHRALAHKALGDRPAALRDYDRALQPQPGLAGAALSRGLLHLEERHYPAAVTDLQAAPAATLYNLALAHLECGDLAAARTALARSLAHDPGRPESLELQRRLRAREELPAMPARRSPRPGSL
jgi:tetratricopeptide (TPR) repeat protein